MLYLSASRTVQFTKAMVSSTTKSKSIPQDAISGKRPASATLFHFDPIQLVVLITPVRFSPWYEHGIHLLDMVVTASPSVKALVRIGAQFLSLIS